MEYVDILLPPTFEKSGETKPIEAAFAAGDWVGTSNVWIIQRKPVPAIVYQVRSPNSGWAPGKLDVSAGGHYSAGESGLDALREVEEELGKRYDHQDVLSLGQRLSVSLDTQQRRRNNVVSLFYVFDDTPLESYRLQEEEVYAICACPIEALCELHEGRRDAFPIVARTGKNETITIEVTRDAFPYNWDSYHQKMAQIVKRLVQGEVGIRY